MTTMFVCKNGDNNENNAHRDTTMVLDRERRNDVPMVPISLKRGGTTFTAFWRVPVADTSQWAIWRQIAEKAAARQFFSHILIDAVIIMVCANLSSSAAVVATTAILVRRYRKSASTSKRCDDKKLLHHLDQMVNILLTLSGVQFTQILLSLQKEEFDLKMKLLDIADERKIQLIQKRLGKMKEMMDVIEKKIDRVPPTKLDFHKEQTVELKNFS